MRIKVITTRLSMSLFLMILIHTSCGVSTSLTGEFQIFLKAKNIAPQDATGDANPTRYTLTLNNLTATDSNGETIDLWDGQDPKEILIGDRDQIIFSAASSKVEAKTLSSIVLEFAGEASFMSQYSKGTQFVWPHTTMSYTSGLTCKKASDCVLYVDLNWKNTLLRDLEAKSDSYQSAPTIEYRLE